MTKSVKTIVYNADGSSQQVYPETHANAIYGLNDFITNYLSENINLAAGTDLNTLSTGQRQASKTFVINGVQVVNGPPDTKFTKWGSITVTDINFNTATQMLIDSAGHRWTRGAGGENKTWNDWKEF